MMMSEQSKERERQGRSDRKRTAGKRERKSRTGFLIRAGGALLLLVMLCGAIHSLSGSGRGVMRRVWQMGTDITGVSAAEPDIDVQLLDVNPYSRPGTESDGIRGIVIHYTANPGSTAQDNRDYFNGLQYSQETKASSNFIVGLDGEIIQCVPTWEIAYASNERNADTVSIECCHPDETGEFTEATYRSLVQLTGWLCLKFGLEPEDVIRHYDVTGKNCPRYFVEHEDAWVQFREDIGTVCGSSSDAS